VAHSLGGALNATPNMSGHLVTVTDSIIHLPSANDFIKLDAALETRFQAQIASNGPAIVVKVIGYGRDGSIGRAIQLQFQKSPASDQTQRLIPIPGSYEEVTP
jgi:hypothetical protein